jgi:hypothetical protein
MSLMRSPVALAWSKSRRSAFSFMQRNQVCGVTP